MIYVRPRPWWVIALLYVLGAVAIGLAVPAMKAYAAARFGRAGVAVAFVVNIAMPLLIVVLSVAYPRLWVALVGTLAASLAFLLTVGLTPRISSDWLNSLVAQMGPILTVAIIAYHGLAAVAVGVQRPFRRVGIRPPADACRSCGYRLTGLGAAGRCPECGQAFSAIGTANASDPSIGTASASDRRAAE